MDNQEAFVQELKEANQNILRLTLALEHYTAKTDEKLVDYKDRFVELDEENEDYAKRIRDLERTDENRTEREGYMIKILYGTVASVVMVTIKAVWDLITKKN